MLQGLLSFELLGLSGNAWFTIAVILALFASMMFSKLRTDLIFVAAMAALYISGVLDVKGAFGGFCAPSVLVIGVLFAVIAGLNQTGVLNWIVKHLMGTPKTLTGAITRLMLPVALLSSLLTNTTIVALFINIVKIWSKKLGISPSKLSGLYTDATGIHLGIFTTTICGLFCLAVGILSVIALQKLLPERKSPLSGLSDDEMTLELCVPSKHNFIGMTLREIYDSNPRGFEKDKNGILAIRRFDNEVEVATPDSIIMGADHIIVSGKAEQLQWICNNLNLKNEHLEGVIENAAVGKKFGKKTVISAAIMIAMVLLSAFNIMPLLSSCLLAAAAMILFRCCSSTQAMNAINWEIIIVFAGSICLGKALEITGVASKIANSILSVSGSNPYITLAIMCVVATFITEFISNTAAAALFCPIALSAASALGVNQLTFCIALMIAASSSFATPIGSPTHMLVYGPGGYHFTDFVKIGLPMNFIILAANIFITTLIFPF